MSARYDVESFLTDLETMLKADFNTKLAAIDTEKNDGMTLATINSNAYFLQTMDTTTSNYDPFIYYGVQDIQTDSIGPMSVKKYFIVVAVILADHGEDTNIGKRVLRYSRALSEVIEEKYSSVGAEPIKAKINSLVPISFQLVDSTHEYRAVGVEIEINLA